MGGVLKAGSWITAGFKLSDSTPNYTAQDITDTVEGCLYSSGSFNTVIAYVKGQGFFDPSVYLTIDAEPYHDFAQPDDVSGFITQVLGYCFPQLIIEQREAVIVNSSPAGSVNNSGGRQSSGSPALTPPGSKCPAGYYDNGWFSVNCVPVQTVNTASPSSQCDWSKMTFGDYAACQLGIKPSQAVIVGVIGALAGVILISKLAK